MMLKKYSMWKAKPCKGQCKLLRISEGETRSFPGNASLTQFFQAGFSEGRIVPDHRALIEEEKQATFKELDDISTKVAHVIRNLLGGDDVETMNPDKDIVIGVCIPRSQKLIFTLFGILKIGATYIPFGTRFPADRVTKIVHEVHPNLIISDPHGHIISKFDPFLKNIKVVSVDYLMTLAEKENAEIGVDPLPGPAVLAERTAIILYTSGSTGDSKGVRLSHRTAMNRLSWQWRTFPYVANERCCFKSPMAFVDSFAEIFGPLLMGQSVTVIGKLISINSHLLIQRIASDKITRIVVAPSMLRAILKTAEVLGLNEFQEILGSVVLWVCSGENLPKDLVVEFFEKFQAETVLANFYGSTETMGDVTFDIVASLKDVRDTSDEVHVPIGRAICNSIVYILDSNLEISPTGEIGEIYIAGYNLASGYVGIPNSAKFVDNPFSTTAGFNRLYRTGDFGRIVNKSGGVKTIFYEGRMDSQIEIEGNRIDLIQVESIIRAKTDLVENAVVLCYRPGAKDQTVVAFIIPKPDVSYGRIEMMLMLKFPPQEIPDLRLVQEIPVLMNGKVDRQRLLTVYHDERTLSTPYDNWHLLNIPEELLKATRIFVETMSEVTGTSQHTIVHDLDDSFYNLGGSSLNSIIVIQKLKEKRFQIPIGDFIAAKSIHDIVAKMQLLSVSINVTSVSGQAKKVYLTESLKAEHQEDVIDIIAYSFSRRGDLEMYTRAIYSEFVELMVSIWFELVERGYSFAIRRKEDNKIIAAAINFDALQEPAKMEISSGIQYVLDFLESIEARHREALPKIKNKVWHSFLMGTHEAVDDSENVYLVAYMMEENIRLAKLNHFRGVFTTITNPLAQQICREFQGFDILEDYQVNHYEAPDGTRPFQLAPDTQRTLCCWKIIDNHGTRPSHLPNKSVVSMR